MNPTIGGPEMATEQHQTPTTSGHAPAHGTRDGHHGGHGWHKGDGKGKKKGFGHSNHHLNAPQDGAQGCSASGGLAPMLLAIVVLAFLMRRPAPVRVRRNTARIASALPRATRRTVSTSRLPL